jgi:hypothetical protein
MKRLLDVVAATVLLLAQPLAMPAEAAAADAPATVGELLDGGGKQLTRDEILKLFAGATIKGTQMGRPDATFEMRYKADGTASGTGTVPVGSTKISGTWSANERNQYCQDLQTADGNRIQGCFYYFMKGDKLYAAPTNGRSERVYQRQLTR